MTYTPMVQQYLTIKAEYQDAFLFFRLGDFYEMFFEDAEKASRELEITLTSRDGGKQRIPMCGVPYHSANQYVSQLIEKGYKVAICEQVEDPKEAKGVVKREVIQVITPGTVMDHHAIKPEANNYITSITAFNDGTFGLSAADLTTGESFVTLITRDFQRVVSELTSYSSREVVVQQYLDESIQQKLKEMLGATVSFEEETEIPSDFTSLIESLQQEKLTVTFGRLLNYLLKTQKRKLDHLQRVEAYAVEEYMILDRNSTRNLELTETIRDKKRTGSLLWLLDQTKTAMGARLLKQWLVRPLVRRKSIEHRQAIVEAFITHFFERESLRNCLSEVYDLERLMGRVAFGNVNARDLIQLKKSLAQIPAVVEVLHAIAHPEIQAFIERIDPCSDIKELIEKGIALDPPLSVKEGGIIQDGYHKTLDEYRYISKNGKAWIANLERSEREATGIKSLKIGYNKVFGYYIEVTKANLAHLPEDRYERKQTLANAERYVTPELKEKEKLILEAEDKMMDLEYTLFQAIREEIKGHSSRLQTLAKVISEIDCLISFAVTSEANHYIKPQFTEGRKLSIKESRHPVIEKVMKEGKFVANDIQMDENNHLLLITGPNMGGKSTFMRQAAITAIMAQIGCFVAADEAELPIFDQIFTRIGAADDLVAGQSTFMVEMLEAQYALTHATQNSLILLDEIGRGTSTYDGIAIAQAIVEYIHNRIQAKTLFSTHYHELTRLEKELSFLKNIHVSAMEEKGQVVFLHKVKDGYADKSYGIHVAELARLPEAMISRARTILEELEQQSRSHELLPDVPSHEKETETLPAHAAQLSFFAEEPKPKKAPNSISNPEKEVLEALQHLDVLDMTPLDALNELYRLQKRLKKVQEHVHST